MLGLTQEEMAALIGVTYPQLCKYERAINRVSSGRLHEIAMAMDVDVTYFFQDVEHLEPNGLIGSPSLHPDLIELSQHFLDMPPATGRHSASSPARWPVSVVVERTARSS